MIRWLLVAILAWPAPVEARGGGCREQSAVVGYQRCRRFGHWSGGAPMWWEAGALGLHFDPKPIDATASAVHGDVVTAYHVTGAPGDDRGVNAIGAKFRSIIGLHAPWYFGMEADLTTITSGPALVADVTARGTTMTMPSSTTGSLFQGKWVFGAHASIGPVVLGTEIALGIRTATFSTRDLPDPIQPPTQMWFLAEVHQKADLWLTPHTTLGVEVGVDVIHTDNIAVAVMLGHHLTPFDETR